MYQKSKDFRSSGHRGASYQSGKRFYTGNSTQRSYRAPQNRGPKQMFVRDINIFIKKANPLTKSLDHTSSFKFSDLPISQQLKNNIDHKGFTNPTPIQEKAIPSILEGQDLIGLANTGTGKTAAFLIPLIDKMSKNPSTRTLIVTPTRELALQIREELTNLSWDMRIYSALIIGGANINRQIYDVTRNPQVVIGTPGRLKDLIQHQELKLANFNCFVLDEVDLMVDIGFINDVKYFISLLPQVRQSLFFSATISSKVKEVLNSFVKNPVTVSVKQQDTAENIDQDVVRVTDRSKKVDQLHDLLIKDGFDKVLVFGSTKYGIEKLNSELERRGFKVGSLHGNKSQGQRKRTLDSFKRDEIQVLLATDVASRGLDIPLVTHVINYDLPPSYEDYIHRIGRTGRADQRGTALTFVE